MTATRLIPLFSLLALPGCVAAMPTHEWRGMDHAIRLIHERSDRVITAAGTAELSLRRADGATVRVDAAFALAPPTAMRIRAWKLDRAVADWTLRPDGVFVWQAEAQGAAEKPQATPWTREHIHLWPLLFGIVTANGADQWSDEVRGQLIIVRRRAGALTAVVSIDRVTLLVRECRIERGDGTVAQRVLLSDYSLAQGVPWPMRVEAEGDAGSFTLDLTDVRMNEELAENALTPPARAKVLR